MSWSRYLAVMGTGWAVAAAAIAGINLVVDPLGAFPTGITIAGFNSQKPLRGQHDRIVKRLDVRRQQPATIFMGSSRIKQTVDPRSAAGTPFAPAYNAAMDGSAGLAEIGAYLREFLDHDTKLRYVFIEVFPSAQLSSPGTAPITVRPDDIDYVGMLFTMRGLENAVSTVSFNRQHPDAPAAGAPPDGYAPIALPPHHFSVRNIFNLALYQKVLARGRSLSPTVVAAARDIIAACRSRGVDCRFFLSPLHADALFAAYYLGLWPELEALKRALADVGPTYDFTRYSALIDERIGPVVYWPEAFHFSPALGDILARVMTGSPPPGVPANFGALLDAGTIESSLAAWRQERDRWIAEHPDSTPRMRRAEEQFLQGVPISVVTEAERAAGGW